MSKASQQRVSAYALGRDDARTGRGFRWARHPHMSAYREGYITQQAAMRAARKAKRNSSMPEQTKPEQTKPEQTKPEQTKPEQTKPEQTNAKPWWQSKIMLINLLASALLLAYANLGVLQGVLPENIYAVVAFALPIVNLVLRAVTTGGVSLRSPQ